MVGVEIEQDGGVGRGGKRGGRGGRGGRGRRGEGGGNGGARTERQARDVLTWFHKHGGCLRSSCRSLCRLAAC